MNAKFLELAPENCPPIPVISCSPDIGQKEVFDVEKDHNIKGIIVQDVVAPHPEKDGVKNMYRQVIFESKPDQI